MNTQIISNSSHPAKSLAATVSGNERFSKWDRSHSPAGRRSGELPALRLTSHLAVEEPERSQSEIFYLQKQIQGHTPMIVVLDDGEEVEGCIEWYDRNTIKVRGRARTLIYKSAIKYMYKVGENG